MHLQLVSGAPNVTFTSPNKFTFTLPSQYRSGENDQVSLKSLRLYYSWFNMTAAKNNNSFSYTWVDNTVHTVTLPDGIWSYADFQKYLEQVMLSKNHYLLDSNNRPVYYIKFESNSVFYRISLSVSVVPAVLPSGYTAPSGWVAQADKTPLVNIPATAIRSYLGFEAGSYPNVAQATLYQVNGPNVPQVTDITSLMLQSNLANNEYGPDSRTLASFNVEPGSAPGSLISEIPFYQDWIPVQPMSKFTQVTLLLVDQNSRPVKIEDTAGFIATLNLKRE